MCRFSHSSGEEDTDWLLCDWRLSDVVQKGNHMRGGRRAMLWESINRKQVVIQPACSRLCRCSVSYSSAALQTAPGGGPRALQGAAGLSLAGAPCSVL